MQERLSTVRNIFCGTESAGNKNDSALSLQHTRGDLENSWFSNRKCVNAIQSLRWHYGELKAAIWSQKCTWLGARWQGAAPTRRPRMRHMGEGTTLKTCFFFMQKKREFNSVFASVRRDSRMPATRREKPWGDTGTMPTRHWLGTEGNLIGTHTYTHTHIHTYTHTHIHTYTHVHTYTHTHIHTYTQTLVLFGKRSGRVGGRGEHS